MSNRDKIFRKQGWRCSETVLRFWNVCVSLLWRSDIGFLFDPEALQERLSKVVLAPKTNQSLNQEELGTSGIDLSDVAVPILNALFTVKNRIIAEDSSFLIKNFSHGEIVTKSCYFWDVPENAYAIMLTGKIHGFFTIFVRLVFSSIFSYLCNARWFCSFFLSFCFLFLSKKISRDSTTVCEGELGLAGHQTASFLQCYTSDWTDT